MVRRIKVKRVLELRAEGVTGRAIALAQGMSRKSVLAVFDAADQASIGRDGHVGRSDAEAYALLFPGLDTSALVPGFTLTRSWTASCTTQSGSRQAATTYENTPPARSRHRPSRGRASPAPDRATARRPKAIRAAPEGNIQWLLDPQILMLGQRLPFISSPPNLSGQRPEPIRLSR